jgi:galactose mutarotase-like enzyme
MSTLSNNLLKIQISTHGAELNSILGLNDNLEYLWNADENYWKRHAPILFPIVGKLNNNTYRVNQKNYTLSQHGFARDSEFKIYSKENNSITYILSSSINSLKVYPYEFDLYVSYTLIKNKIEIKYSVKNKDSKKIYFSLGAHPGFNCPLLTDESINDYYFEFEKIETAYQQILDSKLGLFTGNSIPFFKNNNILDISNDLFKNDALVFKNLDSKYIALKSRKSTKSIVLDFDGFPCVGLWSKPEGAPFVCIEPWFGHADYVDFEDDFSKKAGILELPIGETFDCNYSITINQ